MKARHVSAILGVALAALALAPGPGHAWKPYTHNFSADQARLDAIDDGRVTVDGRSYALRAEVVAALRDWPAYYNAGVVGPDGFPDLTYGQAVIHPVKTGEWLRHIYIRAWLAQGDASYSAVEKSQILAFAYGFLTHAAGDMWGHTLINDFADPDHTEGVFPAFGDILTSVPKAAIAVRHVIAEGYVGDATPGFDNNPERGAAPQGDVSDDATPSYPYRSPNRFLYETLVNPATVTPVPAVRGSYADARGPVIGFFLELRDDLQEFVNYDPDPLADAINAYDDTVEDLMALECACNFGSDAATGCSNSCCPFDICTDFCDGLHDVFACPAALLELGFDIIIDTFEAFLSFVVGVTEELALAVLDSYLDAWIDDIDAGLRNWGQLGLATTRGLFDPQARRDLQNDECQYSGGEGTLLRAQCEDDVGALDVVLHEVDPFINAHLLSMIGLPDLVGDVREIVGVIADVFDDILGFIGMQFNPLQQALAQLKEWVTGLLKDLIAHVLGIDIDSLEGFLKEPSRWLCLSSTPFTLPDPLGSVTIPLFPTGSHARMDQILGLPAGHHELDPGLPEGCGRIADGVEFVPDQFAPLKNTITMSKLLLLDGAQVNQVLGDILDRTISTYAPGQDIMVTALDGETWLRLIDGDHAWRQDGAPVFGARDPAITGGIGQFPLWESCVLRPAFRTLFTDWENGTSQFPELDDPESADPVNDPNPPTSTLTRSGAFYDDGIHQFVAADNLFTHTALDTPPGKAYPAETLQLQHRAYPTPGAPSAFVTTGQPARFSLTGADGLYTLDVRSADHCHVFGKTGLCGPEETRSSQYVLDASAPVTRCANPPFDLVFDTDDRSTLEYTLTDGTLGSGVQSESATLDGYLTAAGVASLANHASLDMYLLYPGTRTVSVSATDNLGNAGTHACLFEVRPTIESMLHNLDRALDEGLLKTEGTHRSLQAKLMAAAAAAERGQCGMEANLLNAFTHEVRAQSGGGVEAVLADRLIAYALYLAAQGDPLCTERREQEGGTR